jgi:phosphatidylserine decarboxylase
VVVSASKLAAESLRVLPRKRLSRMMGRLADLNGPPALVQRAVGTFVRVYDVNMAEAEVPADGYATFDAFFTRRLKDGARPIDDDPETLVCPADGRLLDAGPIDERAIFSVKGRLYEVGDLIGDRDEAARYEGGTFAVVYLAPPDYHRVHAPAEGRVTAVRHVTGTLFPVNAIGMEHIEGLFVENERVVVHQETDEGDVATILVGAIGVGRIGVAFDDVVTNVGRDCGLLRYDEGEGPTLRRGDEIGMFHLGSTAIVLVGPPGPLATEKRRGERTRVGEPLFRRGAA